MENKKGKIINQPVVDRLWIGGREVDFHLIAAAPELLEALEFMVWYTELVYSSEILKKLEDKARAAIAKAKGEE
jgi:hypothetical protein